MCEVYVYIATSTACFVIHCTSELQSTDVHRAVHGQKYQHFVPYMHAETAVKYGLLRYYPKCVPVTRQPKQDLRSYGI